MIDLAISGNTVVNKVNGQVPTLPAGISFADSSEGRVAVFNSGVIGGISFPHNANYAPGTDDFTIEAIIDADGLYTEPADNSRIIPIMSWGDWGAAGHYLNLDFLYNDNAGGGLSAGHYHSGTSVRFTKYGVGILALTKYVHIVAQRKDGIGYLWQDGVLIGSAPYAANVPAAVAGEFRIMSRRGGDTGNVWWRFIGKLRGFRYTKAAIYPLTDMVPVMKF